GRPPRAGSERPARHGLAAEPALRDARGRPSALRPGVRPGRDPLLLLGPVPPARRARGLHRRAGAQARARGAARLRRGRRRRRAHRRHGALGARAARPARHRGLLVRPPALGQRRELRVQGADRPPRIRPPRPRAAHGLGQHPQRPLAGRARAPRLPPRGRAGRLAPPRRRGPRRRGLRDAAPRVRALAARAGDGRGDGDAAARVHRGRGL
ncbi:MAG: GCN5-related N-acetyltransferase, partial [uncultured Solirubrobacteraceae bacterium]